MMKRPPLDDGTADRLLAGAVAPSDAPAGYGEVARLVQVARGPAAVTEVLPLVPVDPYVGTGTVISMSAARNRRLAVRMAAAAAVVVALSGTAAAAASGSLPGPAQRAVSSAARSVGLDIPSDNSSKSDKAEDDDRAGPTTTSGSTTTGEATTVTTGPALPGPALNGLCNAYGTGRGGAEGGKFDAAAFVALEEAAGVVDGDTPDEAAKKVADYCKVELEKLEQGRPADKPPVTTGKPADPGRPADKPPVTTGKPPSDRPPVTTPAPPVSTGQPANPGKPAGTGTTNKP
ncbi:MAG TPA: hypothetical protein VF855_03070 [Acidimicrobiales bacterium]